MTDLRIDTLRAVWDALEQHVRASRSGRSTGPDLDAALARMPDALRLVLRDAGIEPPHYPHDAPRDGLRGGPRP